MRCVSYLQPAVLRLTEQLHKYIWEASGFRASAWHVVSFDQPCFLR